MEPSTGKVLAQAVQEFDVSLVDMDPFFIHYTAYSIWMDRGFLLNRHATGELWIHPWEAGGSLLALSWKVTLPSLSGSSLPREATSPDRWSGSALPHS